MVNICPKLDKGKLEDKELLKKLLDEGFSSFELHTDQNSNWTELSDIISNSGLNVESVHTPNKLKDGRWSNPCRTGDVGKKSTDVLNEVVQFSKQVQSRKVVFHTWSIPYGKEGKLVEDIEGERRKARECLVDNMLQVECPEVTLLPEVSPVMFWMKGMIDLCPATYTPNDFKEIIDLATQKTSFPNIGITADIDHIYRTAICDGAIYAAYFSALRLGKSEKEIIEKFVCGPMLNCYRRDSQLVNHLVEAEIDRLFEGLDEIDHPIPHVHACGVDFPGEEGIEPSLTMPMGEHIPIGYKGESSYGTTMGPVKDILDHKFYLKHVKGTNTAIILEFSTRKEYDFFEQVVNSRAHLEKELAEL